MKAKDADIIIIPGYTNSGADHWQSRWEEKLSSARRVEQEEWSKPVREDWVQRVADVVNSSTKPVVLVAHSLGIPTALHALPLLTKPVVGAFFVAPPDVSNPEIKPKHLMTFGPYPTERLDFPSVVVASRNDAFCDFSVAEKLAQDWGSLFIDAGDAGHLNAESGHGPWPEGLLTFAHFMAKLRAPGEAVEPSDPAEGSTLH